MVTHVHLTGTYDQVYWDWLAQKSDVKVKVKSQNMFRSGKSVLHLWTKSKFWPHFKSLIDNTVEFSEPRLTNENVVMNCHALALTLSSISHCPLGLQLTMQAMRFLVSFPIFV